MVAARSAVLSVITGGGKWVEITTHADPLYRHLIATAERKLLALRPKRRASSPIRCRATPGRELKRFGIPQCVLSGSNSWAQETDLFPQHPAGLSGP